jgi:hypothetical protein
MFRNLLMRIFSASFLIAATNSHANINSIADLTRDKLVGTWEALVQRAGIGPGVYQIVFTAPDKAWFVEAWPHSDPDHVRFLGRLMSAALADGKINLKFAAVGESFNYPYVSVEINGQATTSGESRAIYGTISTKRQDGKSTTEPVLFAYGLWTRSIAEASEIGQKAIRQAQEGTKRRGRGRRGQS